MADFTLGYTEPSRLAGLSLRGCEFHDYLWGLFDSSQ